MKSQHVLQRNTGSFERHASHTNRVIMKNKQHYENLIIGFGKAGKTLAVYLAKHNKQVALIERSEKMYGGSCISPKDCGYPEWQCRHSI